MRSTLKMVCAVAIVVLLSATAARAQGPSSAELEAYRAQFVEMLQGMASQNPTAVADAIAKVQSLPVTDLITLYTAAPKDGPFWKAAHQAKEVLKSAAGRQSRARQARGSQMVANGTEAIAAPVAGATAEPCTGDWKFGGDPYEQMWMLRNLVVAAEIAKEVITEDILTAAVQTPLAIAWSVLRAVNFIDEQAYQRWNDCRSQESSTFNDAAISSRASQTSVNELQTSIGGLSGSLGGLNQKLAALGPVELSANVVGLKDAVNAATPKISRLSGAARIWVASGAVEVAFASDDNDTNDNIFAGPTPTSVATHGSFILVPPGTIVTLYENADYTGPGVLTLDATEPGTDKYGLWRFNLASIFNNHGPRSLKVTQSTFTTPDVIASQTSVNTLTAKVDGLSLGSTGTIATQVASVSTTVNTLQSSVAGMTPKIDATVSSRATQSSVSQLQTGVSSIQSTVGSINATSSAVHGTVTALQGVVGTLQTAVAQVGADVGAVKSSVAAVDLSKLDSPVSTRASQAGLESLGSFVQTRAQEATLTGRADAIDAAIGTVQLKINALDTAKLDTPVSSRAEEATLKTRADAIDVAIAAVQQKINPLDTAKLDTTVSSRAQEATLKARADAIDASLAALQQRANTLDTSKLDATISTRAQESTLLALGTNTAAGLQAIQNKVSALDTGKLDAATSTRLSQSSLDMGVAGILTAVRGQNALSLQIVETQKGKRYLVYVTLAGAPAAGAALSRFQTLDLTGSKPAVTTDATAGAVATEVAPGILDIALNAPGGKTDAVALTVKVTVGGVTTTGSSILQSK